PAGVLTSVRVAGSLVFITSVRATQEHISILRMTGGPAGPYTLVGTLNFAFPDPWEHKSYALAVRPAPGGGANAWELYFNVGSDELNVIARTNLAASVPNFGFPNDYIEYRTGNRIGSGGVQPLVAFQPTPDGWESEGPSEIAFAPAGFPPGLNNGVFVGFFGQ